jgi:tripartite-type tricarboxylate transporter receptor subunit TctC
MSAVASDWRYAECGTLGFMTEHAAAERGVDRRASEITNLGRQIMTNRTRWLISISVLAMGLAGIAMPTRAEQKFPSRPIQMVIPTAPGGGTDISLRMLASLAEPILGSRIVIVNKTGGDGTVGMAAITEAKPDGYTIGGLWNAPLTMTPHMFAVPYKPTSYVAISHATSAPLVFCTKKDFPAGDGKEFIAELKKQPDKYTYGDDGVGGTVQLSAERIFAAVGVKARAVPFAGAGETLKTFLGGDIDIYGGSIPPILPYVKQGDVKCLLLTSADRSEALPQASSLTDLGIPDVATVLWRGIIAPLGLPPDRLATLEHAFEQAAKNEKFQKFMESRGEEAIGSDSAAFRKLIDGEYAALGKVMANLGLAKF